MVGMLGKAQLATTQRYVDMLVSSVFLLSQGFILDLFFGVFFFSQIWLENYLLKDDIEFKLIGR